MLEQTSASRTEAQSEEAGNKSWVWRKKYKEPNSTRACIEQGTLSYRAAKKLATEAAELEERSQADKLQSKQRREEEMKTFQEPSKKALFIPNAHICVGFTDFSSLRTRVKLRIKQQPRKNTFNCTNFIQIVWKIMFFGVPHLPLTGRVDRWTDGQSKCNFKLLAAVGVKYPSQTFTWSIFWCCCNLQVLTAVQYLHQNHSITAEFMHDACNIL